MLLQLLHSFKRFRVKYVLALLALQTVNQKFPLYDVLTTDVVIPGTGRPSLFSAMRVPQALTATLEHSALYIGKEHTRIKLARLHVSVAIPDTPVLKEVLNSDSARQTINSYHPPCHVKHSHTQQDLFQALLKTAFTTISSFLTTH